MQPRENDTDWCPLERALDLIGGKWKGLIIWYLGAENCLGHAELMRRLESVSQKVMTAQLRQLERDGLVARRVYRTVPPRVDYRLTPLGDAVRPAVEALRVWASDRRHELAPAAQLSGRSTERSPARIVGGS